MTRSPPAPFEKKKPPLGDQKPTGWFAKANPGFKMAVRLFSPDAQLDSYLYSKFKIK
jgi:hypothetical protein